MVSWRLSAGKRPPPRRSTTHLHGGAEDKAAPRASGYKVHTRIAQCLSMVFLTFAKALQNSALSQVKGIQLSANLMPYFKEEICTNLR